MVQIVCARSVIISKASKDMYYEFRAGKPVEIQEEHLQFLPGWGSEKCEFKKIDEFKKPKTGSIGGYTRRIEDKKKKVIDNGS